MYRIALAWLAVTFTFAGAQGDPPVVTLAGAVPVFVFAGQSNAVGVDTLDELRADQRAPQPNVLFYGPNQTGNTWGVFTPSSNSPNRIDGTGRGDWQFWSGDLFGQDHFNALGGALVAQVKSGRGRNRPCSIDGTQPVGRPVPRAWSERVNRSIADLQTEQRTIPDMSPASSGCRARATPKATSSATTTRRI